MVTLATLPSVFSKAVTREQLIGVFREVCDRYILKIGQYGIIASQPTERSVQTFLELDSERQHEIVENILLAENLLREIAESPTLDDEASFSLKKEISSLRRELFRRKWALADESIIDLIDDGDIIEVFDARGVQVYRSWSFFKFCSYSLIDLLTNDWNTLFARPSVIVEKLMKMVPLVFAPGAKTTPVTIGEYLVRERISEARRSLLFDMKYVSPLVDPSSRQTVGFICTGRVQIVGPRGALPGVEFI